MSTTVTDETTIQDALVALLTAGADDLAVDDRDVTIVRELPPAIRVVDIPFVAVDRPRLRSDERWDSVSRRRVYVVPIVIVDGGHQTTDRRRDSMDRVDLLRDHVVDVLRAAPHLGLGTLRVQQGFVGYTLEQEPLDFGGEQFVGRGLEVDVPILRPY